jgi:site-specific recombinase XerD
MRHEFVSHLLDHDVPIHEVRELARHSDIQTTMTYVKARDQRLREAARKMGVGRAG